jgi:hypothetical protein
LEIKRAVIQASRASTSAHITKQGQHNKPPPPTTMLSAVVGLLTEPLSKTGRKTDQDHLIIELVLHFIRNLLCAEPVIKTSTDMRESSDRLQEELIAVFSDELVLDIILVLSQQMTDVVSSGGDSHYNLLLMEIIHHLIKHADPITVAKFTTSKSNSNPKHHIRGVNGAAATATDQQSKPNLPLYHPSLRDKNTSISLRSVLSKERQRVAACAVSTTRHGHFGGTLMKLQSQAAGSDNNNTSHKRTVFSSVLQTGGATAASAQAHVVGGPAKAGGKKNTPFISESKSMDRNGNGNSNSNSANRSPTSQRANQALQEFCRKFVAQGYKPLMKSLKNEFRRDSVRLEDADKIVFFRIIWFFSKWQRVTNTVKQAAEHKKRKQQQEKTTRTSSKPANTSGADADVSQTTKNKNEAQYEQLTVTMDVFSFTMVVSAIDTYMQRKLYYELGQTVSLYLELVHILHAMMHTSKDEVEHVMSLGIQFKLFYDNDPLEKLPQLLRAWQEGLYSKEYICDLVELCHMTLKLLDANKGSDAALDADTKLGKRGRSNKKSKKMSRNQEDEGKDRMTQMKDDAADFDVVAYIGQLASSEKIVTGMYTHLLSRYATNEPHINHHIVAFFLRVCRFCIHSPERLLEIGQDTDNSDNIDASLVVFEQACNQSVTLEPTLYHVRLLGVFSAILNDTTIRSNKDFAQLRQFSGTMVRHFAEAAHKNPLLFLEMLFKHNSPTNGVPDFCERITNLNADEDLRMIVTRTFLQRGLSPSSEREDEDEAANEDEHEHEFEEDEENDQKRGDANSDNDDDSSNDGNEFPSGPRAIKKVKKKRKSFKKSNKPTKKTRTNKPSAKDDDVSSEEEQEFDDGESERQVVDKDKGSSKVKVTNMIVNKGESSDHDDDEANDNDRWNDRRKFAAPSHKKRSRALASSSGVEEDSDNANDEQDGDSTPDTTTASASPLHPAPPETTTTVSASSTVGGGGRIKKLKRSVVAVEEDSEEDSDNDLFIGESESTTASNEAAASQGIDINTQSSQLVLDGGTQDF